METPQQKAQAGLTLLKEAILNYIGSQKDGVHHSQIVSELGLESDFEGSQKNYLSWSILGLLVNEKRVRYEKHGNRKIYFLT
jgi:hypothetical protein